MKKPSLLSFLFTLILVAAAVCIQGERVTDTYGFPLSPGEQYFIQPVKTWRNNGGGLVPAAITFPFCPLGITQTLLPYQPGLPVSFSYKQRRPNPPWPIPPVNIPTSYALNIKFESNIWPFCNEFSTLWKFDDSSSAPKEPPILIGGTRQEQNSIFMIESAGEGENTYKLTTFAGTVGAIPGVWFKAPQLVLTNDTAKTLVVKFKRVIDPTTAATSISRAEKQGLRMFPFY
ncbi:PREDICTED: cysteine protease inhibitor WSCP-like [Camelina sativa]|uniref:Cysteine protease inhibitor WSCP-like n=1 Tax=Camelina sativa TaxID=90675 RepID=A0ABM0STN5_CAMSA|nr:PREDICTED: cysteine protease inhibitor WSCP-like [Camelina sativa]